MNIASIISDYVTSQVSFVNIDIAKRFFIYSFGALFLRMISLILTLFATHILSPSDYGALAIIVSFIAIAPTFFGMGLRQVFAIEYFHHGDPARKILIDEIIGTYFIIALPTFITAMLFRKLLISHLFLGIIDDFLFAIVMATVFISFFTELLYQILQYTYQATALILLQVGTSIIFASSSMLFLCCYNMNFASLIIGQAIGVFIVSLIGLILYIKHRRGNPAIIHLRRALYYLSYGAPFIPLIACNWILANIDRWMLAYYGSLHDVGIYSIADLGPQLFYAFILQPWTGAYFPYIMERYSRNRNNLLAIEQENRQNMYICMLLVTVMIIVSYFLCNPLATLIIPATFCESLNYVWIILIGQIFLLGTYFTTAFIQFNKHPIFILVSIAIPASIKIILNALLIPSWRVTACVVTSLMAYGFYFFLTLILNFRLQKQYRKCAPKISGHPINQTNCETPIS